MRATPAVIALTLALSGCSLSRSTDRPTAASSPATNQSAPSPEEPGSGHGSTQPAISATVIDEVHTPEKGSPERQAIMDALRGNQDVVFQVNYLKVHSGWAWVDTTPLDKSGRATAEGGPNLLHQENGGWKVMNLARVPEDPDDPLGAQDPSPTYIRNVIKTFPGVPKDILPSPSK
jgi:hypothetical protein